MARRGPIEPGTVGAFRAEWEAQHCRECGKPFAKVAPRNIVEITPEAKVAPGKHLKSLVGRYCGVTCALSAYDRGIPRHH
jgi:hypothetical protein